MFCSPWGVCSPLDSPRYPEMGRCPHLWGGGYLQYYISMSFNRVLWFPQSVADSVQGASLFPADTAAAEGFCPYSISSLLAVCWAYFCISSVHQTLRCQLGDCFVTTSAVMLSVLSLPSSVDDSSLAQAMSAPPPEWLQKEWKTIKISYQKTKRAFCNLVVGQKFRSMGSIMLYCRSMEATLRIRLDSQSCSMGCSLAHNGLQLTKLSPGWHLCVWCTDAPMQKKWEEKWFGGTPVTPLLFKRQLHVETE